ncbi:Hemolysin-type calcium-binding region [Thalassoporum mexicanum PCC 7367]|uniref:hemolysin-type calcium-binding protein n=1 Tax=Thalassoporum mexicanum TaxID=3457544 RepID=UPI00029FA73A|nr:hemolysin-type calcium-binding protein [Pseudanabaena sp. PCC 7367]AFY71077.1 Hemolysin-type calcium-binding region [Pseudanabaena sp. PCC 7367]
MAEINGTSGNDFIEGTAQQDVLLGLDLNDTLRGLSGDDFVHGNRGFDTVNGNRGRDTLRGGKGNDLVRGGGDDDLLFGDLDSDTLYGDRGADTLIGGSGNDLFVIGADASTDIVVDFSSGDTIALAGGQTFFDLNIFDGNGFAVIQDRLTGQVLATLNNVQAAAIDFNDFVPLIDSTNPVPRSFNIEFDYRFDSTGFFDDPARRANLEAAAAYWESIIKDEFADIPVGTSTPFVVNPRTGNSDLFITDRPIDDLLVFVGAAALGGSTLAESGPSGFFVNESRYVGSNFEPWIGTMAFDQSVNWFFDPTPESDSDIPFSSFDFLSTAIHELAHVMGFGTSGIFEELTAGSNFTGTNARAANDGRAIPLSGDLAHIQDGFLVDGFETLMDPTTVTGVRTLATPIDIAIMSDIGFII